MNLLEVYKEIGKCHRLLAGFFNSLLASVCQELGAEVKTPQQFFILEALCDVAWWESYIPKHKELKEYKRPMEKAVLQQDLADYLDIEPPTACATINRIDSELIVKHTNRSGKWRAVWVEITPYGEKLTCKIRQGINRKLRRMNLPEISAEEIRGLQAIEESLDSRKPV